jgi:hypothetical protein
MTARPVNCRGVGVCLIALLPKKQPWDSPTPHTHTHTHTHRNRVGISSEPEIFYGRELNVAQRTEGELLGDEARGMLERTAFGREGGPLFLMEALVVGAVLSVSLCVRREGIVKNSASELIVIQLILDNLIQSTSYPTKLGKDGEAILPSPPRTPPLYALHRRKQSILSFPMHCRSPLPCFIFYLLYCQRPV